MFFERVATRESDKRQARRFRRLVEQDHPFGRWLQRVAEELNPRAKKALVQNLYGNAWFLNRSRREEFEDEHGFEPPYIMVVDVTARCNLSCEGCWAAHYSEGGDIEYDVLDRVVTEAEEEMGMHFMVFPYQQRWRDRAVCVLPLCRGQRS